MLAKERGAIDIACVGTPDHMHAAMAMSAMQMGLHTYIQKPLAHELYEVRKLTAMARKKKLVTQMGIQIHSQHGVPHGRGGHPRRSHRQVKEVHAWSEKKWGDVNPLPDQSDPVPPGLNWDQWLGVAATRPYIKGVYHPGNWRKRIDFGTATFGDMGCHIYDPVFWALDLTAPISVRSEGPQPVGPNWAINAVIHYVFPGTRYTEGKTLNITWYDGDERPPKEIQDLAAGHKLPGQGSLFIGTEGVMLLPHIAMPVLFPEPRFASYKLPRWKARITTISSSMPSWARPPHPPRSTTPPAHRSRVARPGGHALPQDHPEWNAKKLKFRNSPEANAHLRRRYREGWKVKGLS